MFRSRCPRLLAHIWRTAPKKRASSPLAFLWTWNERKSNFSEYLPYASENWELFGNYWGNNREQVREQMDKNKGKEERINKVFIYNN